MEFFQPKRVESPVAELQKIDLGPKDPCDNEPMLYVIVKRNIDSGFSVKFEERCLKAFTHRAERTQGRYMTLFRDDIGSDRLSTVFYQKPHIYITEALSRVFGHTHFNAFLKLFNDMKDGLKMVYENVHVNTFEESMALEAPTEVPIKEEPTAEIFEEDV